MNLSDATPQALSLLIGLVSGALAWFLGLPLPWLLGAMIGTTFAAIGGAPIRGPNRLRPFVVPIIGVMLGSTVTPDILSQAAGFWPAIALLPGFLVASALVSFLIYRHIGRTDHVTAFFSAMPGGLNDMMILGETAGGDARRIALAHATRILVVITFVVLFYGFVLDVGSNGSAARPMIPLSALSGRDWIILVGCAVIGVRLGRAARLPAPEIFGAMIASGIAHATGLVHTAPPTSLVITAQVVMGTIIGCRFLGVTLAAVGRDVVLGVLSSVGMIAVALAFAFSLTAINSDPLALSFLALSPGGLTEMSLLALAMGMDAIYVTVIHILRITIVIALSVPAFALLKKRS